MQLPDDVLMLFRDLPERAMPESLKRLGGVQSQVGAGWSVRYARAARQDVREPSSPTKIIFGPSVPSSNSHCRSLAQYPPAFCRAPAPTQPRRSAGGGVTSDGKHEFCVPGLADKGVSIGVVPEGSGAGCRLRAQPG
jgi:hypothetical protein